MLKIRVIGIRIQIGTPLLEAAHWWNQLQCLFQLLFVTKRDNGIDSRRLQRRNEAGRHCNRTQNENRRCECGRIVRRDLIKQRLYPTDIRWKVPCDEKNSHSKNPWTH